VLGGPVNPAVVQERTPEAVVGRVNGAMTAAVGSTSPSSLYYFPRATNWTRTPE
jgi:hypothetical protein